MPTREDELVMSLPADDHAPSWGRHAVAEHFVLSALDAENAELVISELVTNAVVYGREPIVLRATRVPGALHIEVQDCEPVMHRASRDSRGLDIVDTVATEWGVEMSGAAKRVWALVPLDR